MFKWLAILKRDTDSWVHAFSFYLLAAIFLLMSGYFFWSGISYFSLVSFKVATNPTLRVSGFNLTEGVLSVFLGNLSLLILLLAPILSMRSLSEEKKQGTLELLFAYPVSNLQIVIGKFASLLALLFILVLPTASYFFMAQVVEARFEFNTVLTGYLGVFLVGASFLSFGLFMSSVTEHQAVSAGIGFAVLLFFWIVGWMADWTSPALGSILREISLTEHFRDLARGIVDTRDIAFFVLFIAFFLLDR